MTPAWKLLLSLSDRPAYEMRHECGRVNRTKVRQTRKRAALKARTSMESNHE